MKIFLIAISMLFSLATSTAALSEPSAYTESPVQTVSPNSSMNIVQGSIVDVVTNSVDKLQGVAILWLSSFVLIQFVITNIGLLKSGADIEQVFAKFLGSMMWFGFCFYLVAEGAGFINKVGGSLFDIASSLTGGFYTPGWVLESGVGIGANLISAVQRVAGITDVGSVIIAGLCAIFVLAVVGFIAFKIFLLQIELALVVMMSPMSFAFLGLNALKDQGIAPFKALISLMYRIVILGVIILSLEKITDIVYQSISSISDSADFFSQITGVGNGIWPALLGIAASYAILGFLAFKSDSIAASLASGSTNLGTADVASAAALGAAAGAAVATGGAALAGGAASSAQPMSSFLKSLAGGNGEIKNAASSGIGGQQPVGQAPIRPPAMSTGSTNKAGVPLRPQTSGSDTPDTSAAPSQAPALESTGMDSGQTAGIGGAGHANEKQLGDLADASRAPKTSSLRDRLSEVNRQIAEESATTHVSINTHNID